MTETIVAQPLALTIHWNGSLITKLDLSWADTVTQTASLSNEALALQSALTHYIEGKTPNWPDLPYDFSQLSDFQRAALDALSRIPQGALCTYTELGARIGKPKAAQAIGKAMGANPFPLVYPCHRVIGANGTMTGFSAEGGLKLKQFLLRHEGAIL